MKCEEKTGNCITLDKCAHRRGILVLDINRWVEAWGILFIPGNIYITHFILLATELVDLLSGSEDEGAMCQPDGFFSKHTNVVVVHFIGTSLKVSICST